MEFELESSILCGHLVKFVYTDPNGDRSKDIEFSARCHFLPYVGDTVAIGATKKTVFVKNIYHSFAEDEKYEEGTYLHFITVHLTSNRQEIEPLLS